MWRSSQLSNPSFFTASIEPREAESAARRIERAASASAFEIDGAAEGVGVGVGVGVGDGEGAGVGPPTIGGGEGGEGAVPPPPHADSPSAEVPTNICSERGFSRPEDRESVFGKATSDVVSI